MSTLTILIVGGYGTFGGRLAELLADETRLTLIIAGRSQAKAAAFCRTLSGTATLSPQSFDRNGDVQAQLKALAPHVVVDATGPFQHYGQDPYRLVKACAALGMHYLDLADGSDFVHGIGQFDEAAKARGVFILSGVSSFPVLTAAVVRELAAGMAQVHSITGGIAPSPYAGVGENVIRAIAGYAGKPLRLVRGGKPATGYALTETLRYTIAPPGKLPLHNLRFSLVDVPDLQVIPPAWPGLHAIWMGAGPTPEILHRALNSLAWLVRLKILPSLAPFAGLFYRVINIVRWGGHRGGMFVEVTGSDSDGQPVKRSWHLLAEGNDGPFIPSMAIEIVIRQMLAGKTPAPGARPATHAIPLSDYEALFSRRTIYTGRREELPAGSLPLYPATLADAWQQLPETIRTMHDVPQAKSAEGSATVERGSNIVARMIATIFSFPKAGKDVPLRVDFTLRNGKEYWTRRFAGKSMVSVQSAGTGRYKHLICECFGPCTFGLAAVAENNRLHLVVRRWNILGVPMPLFLAPGGVSYEYEADGKFHFHVEIIFPIVGLVVRYRGWLV